MSNKKLALILFCIFLALIFISIISIFILSSDISKAELGPSPFKVDESVIAENNPEYQKLIKIAKEIKKNNDYLDKAPLDLKNPEPYILILQDFLKKNEGIIEKVDLELFRKMKFPEQYFNFDNDVYMLPDYLDLLSSRIELQILTKNFEGAANDLILVNTIDSLLIKKSPCGGYILRNKCVELSSIKFLINQDCFTTAQKLEVLRIKQESFSSDFLKSFAYFFDKSLEDNLDSFINRMPKYSSYKLLPYYPILTPYMIQPNKTVKLYRKKAIESISLFEAPSHISFLKLRDSKEPPQKPIDFLKGNALGKMDYMFLPDPKIFARRGMECNSIINQHVVAEKILSFKVKEGVFPPSLADLGLDKAIYTDILTGNDFLYSAENGILQSIGKDGKNDNIELTTKILSPIEIHDILNDCKDDYIFYLK